MADKNENKDEREIEATPSWRKPSGQKHNYGRQNELFNRFRVICLDLHGHPLARDPSEELERKIAQKFSEIQTEFHQ